MNSQRLLELYRTHAAALVLYARTWCSAPDDAVQEALMALAECVPEPDDPVAWLYTAVKRRALNIARADSRREYHLRRAAEGQSHWFTGNSQELAAETVADAVESLSVDERELVVARVWGMLSFEQLGELQNCSASSAHRRYQAALERMRLALEGDVDPADRPDSASPRQLNENFTAEKCK